MLKAIGNFFGKKPAPKPGPMIVEPPSRISTVQRESLDRRPTFSKVFRWHLPPGQTTAPGSVEIAGTFSRWERVPLTRNSELDGWHVTVHHIQGHRTHHYMLLVDGVPAFDRNSDGVAVPHGPDEERFQLQTEKGPRVFMLFAQTR